MRVQVHLAFEVLYVEPPDVMGDERDRDDERYESAAVIFDAAEQFAARRGDQSAEMLAGLR